MAMKYLTGDEKLGQGKEEGFTLIESVVAMGLFIGVVFLLVTVLSGFILDNFASKSEQALEIAQSEISKAESDRDFSAQSRDTLGFHVIRDVGFVNGLAEVQVTVGSSRKPSIIYTKLSCLCLLR